MPLAKKVSAFRYFSLRFVGHSHELIHIARFSVRCINEKILIVFFVGVTIVVKQIKCGEGNYTQYWYQEVNREMFDTIPQGSAKFTKK